MGIVIITIPLQTIAIYCNYILSNSRTFIFSPQIDVKSDLKIHQLQKRRIYIFNMQVVQAKMMFLISYMSKRFKEQLSFEIRSDLAKAYLQKYPSKLPFIVEPMRTKKYEKLPMIDNRKLLLNENDRCKSIIRAIKQKLKKQGVELIEETVVHLFCQNTVLNYMRQIKEMYQSLKEKDGFMYIEYTGQKVFGGG